MRLWLNRAGQISLREQLITQMVLSILGGEIAPGQRLPSTRELGRRFGIHPNTASAAYRQLEQEGWIELRHGSGVFARARRPAAPLTAKMAVDQLIGDLAVRARKLGASDGLVRERMRRWLALAPPNRWLLIEPDAELARIVREELEPALTLPLTVCPPEDLSAPGMLEGSIALSLPSKAAAVRRLLPAGMELVILQVHPVAPQLETYLRRYLPEHLGDLVGIASRWTEFQRIAQTMLIAGGLAPESLLVRDPTLPGWKRGLQSASAVVCDAALKRELPEGCFAIVFRLIAEASIEQLRNMEAALAGPLVEGQPL